jgi:ribosomal protein S18 acetylase RimI-like enzyme
MAVTYFKRFRMEIDLSRRDFAAGPLPSGYRLHPWNDDLIEGHADAKFRSFFGEIDANVFPCLGDAEGCYRLMSEISQKAGFLPEATWLLSWQDEYATAPEYCGTVQGIRDRGSYGAVQNLGIIPGHRGLRLGTFLMCKALQGFQVAGVKRVYLEVTAQNRGAIELYKQLGFRRVRTVYKSIETSYSPVRVG